MSYRSVKDIAYPEKKREYGNWLVYSIILRKVSIFITLFFVKTGISPNFVTLLSFSIGLAGMFYLYLGEFVEGAVIVAFWKLFDCVDGEVARISERFSPIGNILEMLNSNSQYLFLVPSVAAGLLRQNYISVEALFLSFIAMGVFVSIRNFYNKKINHNEDVSFWKEVVYCQFKSSGVLRQKNRVGGYIYYFRYNLIAQNGIIYPALIICAFLGVFWLKIFIIAFSILYFVFFLITFLGICFIKLPE
jgi:phosphatidylglycerophosphate synthase